MKGFESVSGASNGDFCLEAAPASIVRNDGAEIQFSMPYLFAESLVRVHQMKMGVAPKALLGFSVKRTQTHTDTHTPTLLSTSLF
jgi:hypothetical protein